MDLSHVKAIAFDKDGTLLDFDATWSAWAAGALQALAEGDAALTAQLAEAIAYDLKAQRFRPESFVIAGTVDEIAQALAPRLPKRGVAEIALQLIAGAEAAPVVPVSPLPPLLETFKARGLALGVVTNDAEAAARAHLDALGCPGHFDFLAGYDSGHGAKPDAGPLLAFAEAVGCAAQSCAMVGDSLHDLAAARAAEFTAIGVLTGPATSEDLAPMADLILPSIADIPALLQG